MTTEPSFNNKTLRLLTYNIQTGISANNALRGYVTDSWQYVLPTHKRFSNLDNIARLIKHYDIVALQEVDAGSLRSHFTNQVEYLAHQAKFPYWYSQLNRDMGRFAQHSNGLISRFAVDTIEYHALPGRIRGRGAMRAQLTYKNKNLFIINVHLSLGKKARQQQLDYIESLIPVNENVIVLGDMNCGPDTPMVNEILLSRHLICASDHTNTYPSWRPMRALDQVWVSANMQVKKIQAKNSLLSDHLPVMIELTL